MKQEIEARVNKEKNVGGTVVDRETEQGFTPGPWTMREGDEEGVWQIESERGQWQICEIAGCCGANDLPDEQESNANARLIAAAPALYSALRRIAKKGCQVIWCNHEKGFTCLDKQEHANSNPDRYTPEFRAEVLDAAFPCAECQSFAAIALVNKPADESAKRLISDHPADGQAS